jgi:DNA-binding response OmpR family regulator
MKVGMHLCLAWLRSRKLKVNWEGMLPVQGEIIVIEDDVTLRGLMVEIVKESGAKASAFETADDALTYLLQAQGECRLVIVDHGLPGQIQGIEFIEMVRGKWPSIASILTSGYQIDPAAVPPSTIYLHKPWSLDDLITAIAALLQPDFPIRKT